MSSRARSPKSVTKKAEGFLASLLPKGACNRNSWPVIIYGVLALISILSVALGPSTRVNSDGTVVTIDKPKIVIQSTIVAIIWLYLLMYLSAHCHGTAAWIVLLLPVILAVGLVILAAVLGFTLADRL